MFYVLGLQARLVLALVIMARGWAAFMVWYMSWPPPGDVNQERREATTSNEIKDSYLSS